MIDSVATADYIVAFLNELVKVDPKALQALITARVECNEIIAKHPSVQVQEMDGTYQLGILGLLNGLVGAGENFGYIAATFDKEEGVLQGFTLIPPESSIAVG